MAFNSTRTRAIAPRFFAAPEIPRSHALTRARIRWPQPRALLRRRALHPKIVLASEWSLPSICPTPIGSGWGRRACARWLAPPASRLPPPCRAGGSMHRALYPHIHAIAPTARAHGHLALLTKHARGRSPSIEIRITTQRRPQDHGRASGAQRSMQHLWRHRVPLRTPRSADAR